jgi:hypothetical protein
MSLYSQGDREAFFNQQGGQGDQEALLQSTGRSGRSGGASFINREVREIRRRCFINREVREIREIRRRCFNQQGGQGDQEGTSSIDGEIREIGEAFLQSTGR